ncbi:hypothetical protein HNY73_004174 [Argiope bruennichi]|uniref:Uncharacterized protein n=1 Tax=Argiope bruennichi TaxID=94029 RepID=A0A8T0FSW2_ARGBR|nr:hypothetical protein HNY73_004174 [Argiope bruennichi]
MMSMVTAMHGIWPFLLFFTHFITCNYYPWTTAAIILFLNIYFIAASSRWLCSNVYSKTLAFLCFIKNLFSLEWLNFALERVPTETSEENDIRPSATPVIQPRLAIEEDYRPSKAPVIQTKLKSDAVPGPSNAPVIQPRIGTEESYRPSAAPSIQPQLIPEKPHGPSETPVIQPKIDNTALNKASKTPVIQPRFNHSETPKMQSEIESTQPYGSLKAQKIQPRTLQFDEGFPEASRAGPSKGGTWYFRNSGESESPGGTKDEYSRKYPEFKKFQEDDQVGYEDFNQELDSKQMNTSTPKRNREKRSN